MTLHQNPIAKRKRKGSQLSATTIGLINAIMLAGAAHSQTTNAPAPAATSTNAPSKLPDVVVTGQQENTYKPENLTSPKYTEPLRDVPQTVTIIPKALMEEQNATSLRDVLRNVPGISIQAGEGGVPAGDNLSIRGFNARTDLFIDGFRDFGGYSRDPFNVEQVEVFKGPNSSTAGRGSTGGSINLASKTPQLDRFYDGSIGLGTDEYKRFTADFNQPITQDVVPGVAFRLNGMWTEYDTPGRDVVENERWGVAPSISLGLGTPTRATFSYFHLQQDNMPDYGIPWVPANTNAVFQQYSDDTPPVDFENFYGLKDRDFEKIRTDLFTVRLEHDFNDDITLRNTTRYGESVRDSVITAPRFANINATPTVINRQAQGRDQTDTILGNQTDLTTRFETFDLEHTLVTSAEYYHETSKNYTRAQFITAPIPTADLFNPDPDQPFPGEIRRTGTYAEGKADSFALSAFDTVKLNEQWQFNGGLRWDYFDADFKSTNSTPSGPLEISRRDEMLSWRAGVVYKPLPNGSIYAAYGTSFNPAAEGLILSTNGNNAANSNVDPEESRTYEIGSKWDFFENRLAVSTAIFRTEKTNARTVDPGATGGTADDITVLDGEQRVDGFELGVAGAITKEWKAFASYTLLLSEIIKSKTAGETGKELSNTPEQSFSIWTTYDLPWNIQIGGGAQYLDSRYSSNLNTRQAPGYILFDATAAYEITKNISLRLNVYNLADEEYIDRVGGGHFIPGAGRSAALTANFKF